MTYTPPNPQALNYAAAGPGDSPTSRWVAWTVIVVSVAIIALTTWRESSKPAPTPRSSRVDMQIELLGKYSIGAAQVFGTAGHSASTTQSFMNQLDSKAVAPLDKLAAATVAAELQERKIAIQRIDAIGNIPPELTPVAAALRMLYSDGPSAISDRQKRMLTDRLGWFGQLALSYGQSSQASPRASVLAVAYRTIGLVFGAYGVVGISLFIGLILLVIALVRLADRKIQRRYQPCPGGAGLFLEAFAIYVAGHTLIELSFQRLPHGIQRNIPLSVGLSLGPTLLAMAWPLVRGLDVPALRQGLGWHTGDGLLKEMGMGIVGYFAGLPILGVCYFLTIILVQMTHSNPSHPIERLIGINAGITTLIFFLASVYAPLVEETLFRGALFHGLRSRHGWLFSAAVSSLIFAAIHPQGWTLIPMLMSIAIVLAAIREWRATFIASATAHCLHNTMLVLFMVLVMS